MTETQERKPIYVVAPRQHLVEMFCRSNGIPKRDCIRVQEARAFPKGQDVYVIGPVGDESARTLHELTQFRGANLYYREVDEKIHE